MSLCWLVQSRERGEKRGGGGKDKETVEKRAIKCGHTVAMQSKEQNRIVSPPLIIDQIYTSGHHLNRSELL